MVVHISLLYAKANFLSIKKIFGSYSTSKETFKYVPCIENRCVDLCLAWRAAVKTDIVPSTKGIDCLQIYLYKISASRMASLCSGLIL